MDVVCFILAVVLGRVTYEGLAHYTTIRGDLQSLLAWAVGLTMLVLFDQMRKIPQKTNKKKFMKLQEENVELQEENKNLKEQLAVLNEEEKERQKKQENYNFFKSKQKNA